MGVGDKQIFVLFTLCAWGVWNSSVHPVRGSFALSLCSIPLLGSSHATCRFFLVGLPKHCLVQDKISVLAKSWWELWTSVLIQNMWDGDNSFQAVRWILSTLFSREDSTILFAYQSWFSSLQRSEDSCGGRIKTSPRKKMFTLMVICSTQII